MNCFKRIIFIVLSIWLLSCNSGESKKQATTNDSLQKNQPIMVVHPAWALQSNSYEVNIRQYTKEGTFNAFSNHLKRLKDMGVGILWFMPINPISVKDRKGTLGSYYAVQNYTAINPEYGTMDDWKNLVTKAHGMGFKVIIDWVPNHSGADHAWLTTHPDFYVKDSTGKPISPFDWTDTRKLNYGNKELRDSMIACMKFWIKETDIDGFRCDVAGEVPDDFWKECITALRKEKEIFMLAEGDKKELHQDGFDATYPWDFFAKMKLVAKGERPAFALDSMLYRLDTSFTSNAMRMYFTSNHDENSWNKADYETMPGAVHAPFAVLTQTLGRSIPLIYSGQEEPVLRKIEFFEKDEMKFANLKRADFYKTLLLARRDNAALSADANFEKIKSDNDHAVYAFIRSKEKSKVLVVCNLSKKPVRFSLNSEIINGKAKEIFTNKEVALKFTEKMNLAPWGYQVFVYLP